jgi:hypothetical protein
VDEGGVGWKKKSWKEGLERFM